MKEYTSKNLECPPILHAGRYSSITNNPPPLRIKAGGWWALRGFEMTEREQIQKHKEHEGKKEGFCCLISQGGRSRPHSVFVNSAVNLGRTITCYLSTPERHNWLSWLTIRHVLLTASFKAVKVVLVLVVMLCHKVEAQYPNTETGIKKKRNKKFYASKKINPRNTEVDVA